VAEQIGLADAHSTSRMSWQA